jgi:mannose-6-phosphate isomerase-like protein (cupin superfamily)
VTPRTRTLFTCAALLGTSAGGLVVGWAVSGRTPARLTRTYEALPAQEFTRPPERPHAPTDTIFQFDQLEHYFRIPGELTRRLTGDQYGFEALSFIITETHPGGGPGLHVHDTEEAHVLLEGSVRYRIGDKTFTAEGPYVARVPAGVPHTFVNAGTDVFRLIAVFPSKHPSTKRIGPNPLIPGAPDREEPRSGPLP